MTLMNIHQSFRLTIRNVNATSAEAIYDKNGGFRLTIRNVN